jgi:hypothetical protein
MTPLEIARGVAACDVRALQVMARALAANAAEAARVWNVLQHGGLLPQAAAALTGAGLADILNAPCRDALRASVEASAVQNAVLRRLALDVTRRLTEAGLPVMWTKGLWLAHYVYAQPALRVMADVDVFVPPGRRAEALARLLEAGFSTDPTVDVAGLETFANTLRPPAGWSDGPGRREVDLHDAVQVSPGRVWPIDDIWDAAEPVRTGRLEVLVPSPADGLRMLAVHTMKHGLDLRHLMAAIGDAHAIARVGRPALDPARACRRLDDPFEATALYLLLAAAGAATLPEAGREVYARTVNAVDRCGTRRSADRILAASVRARFVRSDDFSLLAVGEAGIGPSAAADLVRRGRRWRRRVALADAPPAVRRRSALRRLAGANWRWAWATYRTGRLLNRLSGLPG